MSIFKRPERRADPLVSAMRSNNPGENTREGGAWTYFAAHPISSSRKDDTTRRLAAIVLLAAVNLGVIGLLPSGTPVKPKTHRTHHSITAQTSTTTTSTTTTTTLPKSTTTSTTEVKHNPKSNASVPTTSITTTTQPTTTSTVHTTTTTAPPRTTTTTEPQATTTTTTTIPLAITAPVVIGAGGQYPIQGQSVTLTANPTGGSGGNVYKWYEIDPNTSVPFSVGSGQSYTFATSTSTTPGTYKFYVIVTDSAGQSAQSPNVPIVLYPSAP